MTLPVWKIFFFQIIVKSMIFSNLFSLLESHGFLQMQCFGLMFIK